MTTIVIDATNATLGRMASYIAKQALRGNDIIIVNCNKAIILGKPSSIVAEFLQKKQRGLHSQKGPKISRVPEKIVKRAVRGMLPYKKGKGAEAFDRIKCYNTVPAEYANAKKILAGKEKNRSFVTLERLNDLFE
jgi:large subunit ribosomal protein L13